MGKLYENKTWTFLYPCLKYYGSDLMTYLASFFKLKVGIADKNVSIEENCIFILIDTVIPFATETAVIKYKNNFSKFLDWLKNQYFYVKDYIYEDINNGEKHMVVLRIPRKHDLTYFYFVRGEYSKMYSEKDIEEYFKFVKLPNEKIIEKRINSKLETTKKILRKDISYLETFVNRVNEDFDTDVESKYFINAELEYPPNIKEEIFNNE